MDKGTIITPEEAALYLNQPCKVYSTFTKRWRSETLTPVILSRFAAGWADCDNLKPVLRYLDDLTEEESREVYNLELGCYPDVSSIKADVINYLDRATISPKTTIYLISKGFDCLELIGSGKAFKTDK